MVPSPKTLILILLLFLPGLSFAQQIISHTTQKVSCRIPYRTRDGKVYECGNAVLREMAKDVLREPWLVRIRVNCDLGLMIGRDAGQDKLFISLRHPAVEGDTVYRRFPVTGELFPSHISMKLKWANRADTTGFTEEALTWKPVSLTDSLVCILPVAPFDPGVDTLMVREVEFFYDSAALQAFFDRIGLIHDYYASVALLDSLEKFTSGMSLAVAGLLPVNYLKIEETSRVLARIEARNFPGTLLQNGYDPSGLVGKYSNMFKHSRSLVYNYLDELRNTGAIPWDGHADRLADYFTSRVLSYVHRSFLMDQQQGPVYKSCLDHLFDRSGFPPEEKVVATLFSRMFPDALPDTIPAHFSKRIYQSYRITARQLIEQNRFAEAYAMMENGRRFVQANPLLNGAPQDELLQRQAAQGICDSYVGIAVTCIRGNKYDMAAAYLAKAGQYLSTHAEYRMSDTLYRSVFSELFFLRNTACDQMLGEKRYSEALDCYAQFERSYAPADVALVSDQLEEKISRARFGLSKQSEALSEDALKRKDADTALYYYEQARLLRKDVSSHEPVDTRLDSLAPVMAKIKYGQIYREGVQALDKRQFTLATGLLQEAKSLSEAYRIDRGPEFDSVYRRAIKNLLIVQLSASQKKIWANQFDSAQAALQKTENAGVEEKLSDDPEFSAALEKYRVRIREQRCRNLQDSVELRMIRAGRGVDLKNFVKTVIYLREALVLARSLPECGIPDQPVMDSLTKYLEPAGYQQKLAEARSLVASGNYDGAVSGLDECRRVFLAQQLGKFGLPPADVFELIRERNNPYLTARAVAFYIDKNDYPLALRFLLLAQSQGLQANDVAVQQEQLGVQFAGSDYLQEPRADVTKRIADHVPDDQWFEKFRSSYVTAWRRLLKETENGGK